MPCVLSGEACKSEDGSSKNEARADFASQLLKNYVWTITRMYYVYMLRSIPNPKQTYVGFTEDLKARFKALSFEKYLMSHSGKAFANKRLW